MIKAGCSSKEIIEKFPFKKEFCGNFNNLTENKKVDLLLKKFSLISNQSEVVIKHGSIYPMDYKNIASLKRFKSVTYNNKLRGSLYGFLIGAVSGLAVSYTVSNFINRNNSDKSSSENGYIALSGYNYIYQFNE